MVLQCISWTYLILALEISNGIYAEQYFKANTLNHHTLILLASSEGIDFHKNLILNDKSSQTFCDIW